MDDAPIEDAPIEDEMEDDAVPSSPSSGMSSGDRLVGEGFTPFQLSYLAVSGGLKEEGIPGGNQLIMAYEAGEISAEDIVEAGASAKRLGTAADDQFEYTQGVERFLTIFQKDARSSS
jgi:hypothetical protein